MFRFNAMLVALFTELHYKLFATTFTSEQYLHISFPFKKIVNRSYDYYISFSEHVQVLLTKKGKAGPAH